MNKTLVIGSDGTDVSILQCKNLKYKLSRIGVNSELKTITNKTSKTDNNSLKTFETALLKNEIDVAVCWYKNLPVDMPKGISIGAVLQRNDPSDLLIINKKSYDENEKFSLKKKAIVATSSIIQKSQLLAFRNDVITIDTSGNIPACFDKLKSKKIDAILLPASEIEAYEIDLDDFEEEKLSPKEFVPAPAQGIMAVLINNKNKELAELLQPINYITVAENAAIEKKVELLLGNDNKSGVGIYIELGSDEEDAVLTRVWVAKSISSDTPSLFSYYEAPTAEKLAERIVKHLNGIKPDTIFITKNVAEDSLFYQSLTGNKFKVTGASLIENKLIKVSKLYITEWVFFYDKYAVEYFFKQKLALSKQKIGVMDKSIADLIRKHGKRAEYIGQSTDHKTVGKQFANKVGNARVMFPVAKGANRTVQWQFKSQQLTFDLAVYEILHKEGVKIPTSNIIIFTSHNNVETYFKEHKIKPSQTVIALGEATFAALKINKVKDCIVPKSYVDLDLIYAILHEKGMVRKKLTKDAEKEYSV